MFSSSTQQNQSNSQTLSKFSQQYQPTQTQPQYFPNSTKRVDFHESLYDSGTSDSSASPGSYRLTGSNSDSSSNQIEQKNDFSSKIKTISSDAFSAITTMGTQQQQKNESKMKTNDEKNQTLSKRYTNNWSSILKKMQLLIRTWFPHLRPFVFGFLTIFFSVLFWKIAFGANSTNVSTNGTKRTKFSGINERKGWFSDISSFLKTLISM
jgi:hypothetical protein